MCVNLWFVWSEIIQFNLWRYHTYQFSFDVIMFLKYSFLHLIISVVDAMFLKVYKGLNIYNSDLENVILPVVWTTKLSYCAKFCDRNSEHIPSRPNFSEESGRCSCVKIDGLKMSLDQLGSSSATSMIPGQSWKVFLRIIGHFDYSWHDDPRFFFSQLHPANNNKWVIAFIFSECQW